MIPNEVVVRLIYPETSKNKHCPNVPFFIMEDVRICGNHSETRIEHPTVKAIYYTYNWLFLWDYTFYKWGYKYL